MITAAAGLEKKEGLRFFSASGVFQRFFRGWTLENKRLSLPLPLLSTTWDKEETRNTWFRNKRRRRGEEKLHKKLFMQTNKRIGGKMKERGGECMKDKGRKWGWPLCLLASSSSFFPPSSSVPFAFKLPFYVLSPGLPVLQPYKKSNKPSFINSPHANNFEEVGWRFVSCKTEILPFEDKMAKK